MPVRHEDAVHRCNVASYLWPAEKLNGIWQSHMLGAQKLLRSGWCQRC